MTEIIFRKLPTGVIACEWQGDNVEIGVMLAQAMLGSPEVAALIMGAIPTFLDESGIDRKSFCEQIMKSAGTKNHPKINKKDIN